MKTLNDNIIKITGTASIPQELTVGRDYELFLTASCEVKAEKENHDNSFDYKYTLQLITGEIKNELGQTMLMDKKRWSQKFRRLIEGHGIDYDKFMAWLISESDNLFIDYENR